MQMKDISRELQKKEEETAIVHVAKPKATAALFCTKCVNLHNAAAFVWLSAYLLTHNSVYNQCKSKIYPERAGLKALSHGAIFHATCLVTTLRDKLHQSLHKVESRSTFCNDCNNFFQRCIV